MAKRIRVSDDAGSNWYTLPGNTGEMNNEAGALDDTIYGQDYASSQTGLIGWTISANGLYKGFAGYVATIKKSGTPTAMTDEPMSLVSGKTYKVTDASKSIWDHTDTYVIEDDSTPVSSSNIESIDHLFGQVTFISSYTPAGVITVTGDYLPMTVLGCSNSFTLTQTANPNDATCMDTAKANNGHRIFEYGLKTVNLELQGIYKSANNFLTLLQNRAEMVIEINPDGSSKSIARGFFKPMSTGQSGDVGDLEQETITFDLSVPDDSDVIVPFTWFHASDTTLSMAVRVCLNAWEDKEIIDVSYLPDGTNGHSGEAIVTDMTLSGGLEAMNEFTVNFQGVGELEAFP